LLQFIYKNIYLKKKPTIIRKVLIEKTRLSSHNVSRSNGSTAQLRSTSNHNHLASSSTSTSSPSTSLLANNSTLFPSSSLYHTSNGNNNSKNINNINSNNSSSNLNNNNNNSGNVVTITRCPSNSNNSASNNNSNNNSSYNSSSQNPASYLNRIPASTTITPTQYYNSKDSSLSSSLSIYPKNSQTNNARNIIQSSNISPVIASPTRASPQAGYAKQPSISPAAASQIHNLPAVLQQQLNELFLKQNLNDPDLLKETLMQYTMYAKQQQQLNNSSNNNIAGSQSSSTSQQSQSLLSSTSTSSSYNNNNNNHHHPPLRNKSVITTSRASAMDVIDLSSNSPTPSRSMSTVAALQLQQAQLQQQASSANKRAHNGSSYMNGNSQSSTRSMQSTASSRLQQMQMQSMNGYSSTPYKIEKSFIDNQMVHCINMIPYSPQSDMIIPLSELRDQFYPNANLDICKRVMQALEINLYSGTK
jgi:hypothetical protein